METVTHMISCSILKPYTLNLKNQIFKIEDRKIWKKLVLFT